MRNLAINISHLCDPPRYGNINSILLTIRTLARNYVLVRIKGQPALTESGDALYLYAHHNIVAKLEIDAVVPSQSREGAWLVYFDPNTLEYITQDYPILPQFNNWRYVTF